MPYFFAEHNFQRTNTDTLCGPYPLQWRHSMDALLSCACRKNFMRQAGWSVFEQARVRRGSSRYPICYYDITSHGIQKVTGPEANHRIDVIVDALWVWGIRKGDAVALTGINSVDYMTLEQAIGCPTEAKWDTRELVKRAEENGAELVTGCRVTDLEITGKAVSAVHGKLHGKKVTFRADLVVLAAGGLGTPVILEQSGIPFVFVPKYRWKELYGQVKHDVRDIIRTLCKYKKVEIIAGAVTDRTSTTPCAGEIWCTSATWGWTANLRSAAVIDVDCSLSE